VSTVKSSADVAVPAALVTVILPGVAPLGTAALSDVVVGTASINSPPALVPLK